MKLSVVLHSKDQRGDHDADIFVPYELKPGETVEDMAARIFGKYPKQHDYITVQLVVEPETS